jgi:hypothetical protein
MNDIPIEAIEALESGFQTLGLFLISKIEKA